VLGHVIVDSYNTEIRDERGFIGDRANKRAFQARVDEWRSRLRHLREDPLEGKPTHELYQDKRGLEEILLSGKAEAAGVLLGAIEDYAHALAGVVHHLLETEGWQRTERIAVGGGFREGRIGELAIGRASVLLKSVKSNVDVDLVPIDLDPDDAALIGSIELVDSEILSGHGRFLATDIGGTNFRAGVVDLARTVESGDSRPCVAIREVWRHANDQPTRDAAVGKLREMLARLTRQAREGHDLAPYLGIACPGRITPDGRIERGAQNLPGDWQAADFNLPNLLHDALSQEFDRNILVVTHNDAVVQGLSQLARMRDVTHWGVLTIGTGLGNAHFTNR
jgi:hypothetical protein